MDKRSDTGAKPVIAAVIEKDGLFLVCRRPAHKRHGGLWEFPGGKIEPGETMLEAATRELKEELKLTVTGVGVVRLAIPDADSGYIINFVDVEACGEPSLIEHAELVWAPPEQLLKLPLAPSDRSFAETLVSLREGKPCLKSD
jgi:mutator protein MutT